MDLEAGKDYIRLLWTGSSPNCPPGRGLGWLGFARVRTGGAQAAVQCVETKPAESVAVQLFSNQLISECCYSSSRNTSHLSLNTFPEDFASLSPSDFLLRLSLLCSSRALQGPRQTQHIEKGRPFLLIRINGRSFSRVSTISKWQQRRCHRLRSRIELRENGDKGGGGERTRRPSRHLIGSPRTEKHTIVSTARNTMASHASFTSPLLTVDVHP
jgi:hypothetical protein